MGAGSQGAVCEYFVNLMFFYHAAASASRFSGKIPETCLCIEKEEHFL
jgi:hypothetical protein